MTQATDVLIVGSGPLGIAAARRLAAGGARVTVIDAGPAITTPAGAHFRNQPKFQRDPDSYFAGIEQFFEPVSGDLPGAAESFLTGGQGILWTNNCPRASVFERWDAMAPVEWEDTYAEAERLLGVTPDAAARSLTGTAIRRRLAETLNAERRSVTDLPFSGHLRTDGTIHFNGPAEILDAAVPEVKARITLLPNTRATRLRHDGHQVEGVEVASPTGTRHLTAGTILVAAGAIGTARLLHMSGIRPPALGHGISFHALLFGQIVLDPGLCPAQGEADIAPRLWVKPVEAAPWHLQVLRDTCPLPPEEAVDNPHRLVEFQAFLPMEFRNENTLNFNRSGNASLRFSFSSRDREMMEKMAADIHRLARSLGPWRRGCEPAWVPHGNAHLVGTCPMDHCGTTGVVDRRGKVHGFDNLFLATVGTIPAPVAVNPTLTALAVTLNTCAEIAARAK
ncbi:FAD-dependent oxidoreductase [Rhodobacteraceae bacterium NNCM2]|nr:FAD-dependent oxidoreductase [Coraliihabitans acroporae]